MKSERDNFKRRLGRAEQDLVDAKEQCITLTTNMQQLEREVSHQSERHRTFTRRIRTHVAWCMSVVFKDLLTRVFQAHMYKLSKETVERNRSDDLTAMTKRAEQRETELNAIIDSLESRHGLTVTELEDMITAHESLITKLQEECSRLTTQLENVSNRYK